MPNPIPARSIDQNETNALHPTHHSFREDFAKLVHAIVRTSGQLRFADDIETMSAEQRVSHDGEQRCEK